MKMVVFGSGTASTTIEVASIDKVVHDLAMNFYTLDEIKKTPFQDDEIVFRIYRKNGSDMTFSSKGCCMYFV